MHDPMPEAPRISTPTEVNSENGFCVLRVKARGQRDLITLVGHAAMISAGDFVQASGVWINDRTHGVQFRASFLKATAPTTIEEGTLARLRALRLELIDLKSLSIGPDRQSKRLRSAVDARAHHCRRPSDGALAPKIAT
jgi:hypothetical protein